jgi:CRP-like cAMP-binding protein
MQKNNSKFKVVQTVDCPLYSEGDTFSLSGIALTISANKPACIFVTPIISEVAAELSQGNKSSKELSKKEFNCKGCSGFIKFIYSEEEEYKTLHMRLLAKFEEKKRLRNKMSSIGSLLKSSSIFNALEEDSLKDIISCAKVRTFKAGVTLMRRGSEGKSLYTLLSGRVALLDQNGNTIAYLRRGEIFGEMSLLSGQPVSADIKAVNNVKALQITGDDLHNILLKYPFLQMSFTRLLAQRLQSANDRRSQEIASGVTGRIQDIPASELFQMIHENMKSGAIELLFPEGKARAEFVEGEIISATYAYDRGSAAADKSGPEAFYAILQENDGSFKYSSDVSEVSPSAKPIGGFMKLLMDGLRQIDEENNQEKTDAIAIDSKDSNHYRAEVA